jgi:hypothetical protein
MPAWTESWPMQISKGRTNTANLKGTVQLSSFTPAWKPAVTSRCKYFCSMRKVLEMCANERKKHWKSYFLNRQMCKFFAKPPHWEETFVLMCLRVSKVYKYSPGLCRMKCGKLYPLLQTSKNGKERGHPFFVVWRFLLTSEPEFLNFSGAQESIPRNQFRQAE